MVGEKQTEELYGRRETRLELLIILCSENSNIVCYTDIQ